MSAETRFITALRALVTDPAARGLSDDAAVLTPPPGEDLAVTHDMMAEGVHYLPTDPPGDVAWKLLAVNLSDLAAKGARPLGVVMGFTLRDDSEWDDAFVAGLGRALLHFDVPLLGGDTVHSRGPRVLGLTAIGAVPHGGAPARSGAEAGDDLWLTGTVGDAGHGLAVALGDASEAPELVDSFRRPEPRLAAGIALASFANAMMDVSDGLLIDSGRMAVASGVRIDIDLDSLPLSPLYVEARGDDQYARLFAATAGDDYELLLAAPPAKRDAIAATGRRLGLAITRIGGVAAGLGVSVRDRDGEVTLPDRLGYEHGA